MRRCNAVQVTGKEALFIEQRFELSAIRKDCGLAEDFPVMRLSDSSEQRRKREDAGVCGAAKRERSERMGAPAEAVYHVAGVALDGVKRIASMVAALGP